MKKKILMALALVSVGLLSIGGTVAFFTDNESSTAVYTVGDINIRLVQNDVINGVVELMPGVNIDTKSRIENIGNNDAYVWLTLAIPTALDSDSELGIDNILHWNTMGAFWNGFHDKTKYHTSAEEAYPGEYTYPVADENTWIVDNDNPVYQEIDGISYTVYSIKYVGVLKPEEITTPGLSTIYLDTKLDYNEETEKWVLVQKGVETPVDHDFSGESNVIIKAHAIQADTFDSFDKAYAAYYAQNNVVAE